MENVCQKCGEKVNDANIAACQGTPDGGCVWKSEALAAASVPVENIKPELRAVQALAAPKLTPADIEAVVVHEQYFTAADGVFGVARKVGLVFTAFRGPEGLDRVTFCVLTLRNGCKVTGVNHGPVSAANFDAAKGREYARENAIEKVWELEGYLLRERMTQTIRITPPDKQKADLVNALRNAPTGALEVAADPDAEKAAKVLAIVRAFVEKQRISFPEVIHQTDRVIENAYGLIQDLVDVAGYLPEEDEDDEASA